MINGRVEIFGLDDIGIIDWNIIWKAKSISKLEGTCTFAELQKKTCYLFKLEIQFTENPEEFKERLNQLSLKSYLTIGNNLISVTDKVRVVNIWANFITKKITIEDSL